MARNYGKKAAMGEAILMIYRVILVGFVAFVIFGISILYYDYYVDVRDVEAQILAQKTLECVAGEGVLNLDKIVGDSRGEILKYCGYDSSETERFSIWMVVYDLHGNEVPNLNQGDSGLRQIKKYFERKVAENVEKYNPGGFEKSYFVRVKNSGHVFEGSLNVEAFVSDEF